MLIFGYKVLSEVDICDLGEAKRSQIHGVM